MRSTNNETAVAQPVPIAKRIGRTGEVLMGFEVDFKSFFMQEVSLKMGCYISVLLKNSIFYNS